MKTTEEWFNQLDDKYKSKALKNMKYPEDKHYSLTGAISNGFKWEETSEGKEYWTGVFREIMYGEKFEPKKEKVETTEVTFYEPKVEKEETTEVSFFEKIEDKVKEETSGDELFQMYKKQSEKVDNTTQTFSE